MKTVAKKSKNSIHKNGNGEGSILKLADGSWRGFITIGFDSRGKQIKKWRRGKTRRIVAEKLNKIAAEAGSRLITRPEQVTVGEWLVQFAALKASEVKPRTRENHQHYLSKLQPELGHIYLHKFQALQIKRFYSKLAQQGLSPSVRQHIHHFLKAALREALKLELIEKNPIDVIDTPKGGRLVHPQVWRPDEVKQFLNTARNDRLYGLFYCLLALGTRIGELIALKWSDLDGDKLHIERTAGIVAGKLVIGTPKTRRSIRSLYLSPDVLEVLAQQRETQALERSVASSWTDNQLIFATSVGTYPDTHNVRRSFRRLIKAADVPNIRIHDLRHTYITLARDAGIDAEVVADRVGQDVRVTMQIYSQVTEDRKRKAARNLEDLLNDNQWHLRGTYRPPKSADSNPYGSN
ncbi:MAG: site-specific integrase [Deinococcota bacterium]